VSVNVDHGPTFCSLQGVEQRDWETTCGPRLPGPDAELYSRAHMTILAISHDLTIFQIESQNFQIESLHLKSNPQNGSNSNWDLSITDS